METQNNPNIPNGPNTPLPPQQPKQPDKNRKLKRWNIIIGIIDVILLLLLIFWPKQCGCNRHEVPINSGSVSEISDIPLDTIDSIPADTRDLENRIDSARQDAGGETGQMGMTLIWNEGGEYKVDFDAHAKEPTGEEICFKYHNTNKGQSPTHLGGKIDIDMISQPGKRVENILWPSMAQLVDGVYRFSVVNYNGKENNGFEVQIYIGNKSYIYKYTKPTREDDVVKIADVTIRDHRFESIHNFVEPIRQ